MSSGDDKAARKRAWYAANRDKIAARQKAYREANREKVAARQKAYRESKKSNQICWARDAKITVFPEPHGTGNFFNFFCKTP